MKPSSAVSAGAGTAASGRAGRRRDHSLDSGILHAALDVLAETGYHGMTVDAVAARTGTAKTTIYRRWPTKEELLLAAIVTLGRPPEHDDLPDTGSLRSDLIAVVNSGWLGGPERRLRVLTGLTSTLARSPRLADAVHAQISEPYVEVYRRLLQRAVARREVHPDVAGRVDVLAEALPAIATYRMTFTDRPVDRVFFETVVDDVVLPAVGLAGPGAT